MSWSKYQGEVTQPHNLAKQQEYLEQCRQDVSIPQKHSQDVQKYPGLLMTPSGITLEAETQFHHRNQRFGVKMVGSRLQPPEIRLANYAVHLPSQKYRFHGAQFRAAFLIKESNYLTTLLLPKLGFA